MRQDKLVALEITKAELEIIRLKSKWERWSAKWIPIVTVGIAMGVFSWNVHQFNAQQSAERTWKKAEFLTTTVGRFDSAPRVQNAKQMLDSLRLYKNGRKIKLFPDASDPKKAYTMVTPDDIYSALDVNKESLAAGSEERVDKLIAISDCFDAFLSGLEDFDHYIQSGLFTADELRLDLEYWVKLIGDKRIVLSGPNFRKRLQEYANRYEFKGVDNLIRTYVIE
jgi:hypothetical protein